MQLLSPPLLFLFAVLGGLGGFLAGLLGIGGGIIFIPLFLWVFPLAGFSPEHVTHIAFGTSLALIIPTAISSVVGHRRHGNVDWHQVYRISVGGAAGAIAGAFLASRLSAPLLMGLFGLMQILVGLKLFWRPRHLPPERSVPIPLSLFLLVGFSVGLFSAFFGVGGGVIAVPLMILLMQLPTPLAVGNSSALIVIASIFGAASYVFHGWEVSGLPPFSCGFVNLLVVLLMAPAAVVGAHYGVRVASRLPHDKLLRAFSLLLIFIGVRMILRAF